MKTECCSCGRMAYCVEALCVDCCPAAVRIAEYRRIRESYRSRRTRAWGRRQLHLGAAVEQRLAAEERGRQAEP